MVHVLEDESLGLIKNQGLYICQEVTIDLLFERVCLLVGLMARNHPHGQRRRNDDIRGVELLIETDLESARGRLDRIEGDPDPEVVVEGLFFGAELFPKLLLFTDAFPLALIRQQNDLLNDLERHLLERRQDQHLGPHQALVLPRLVLEGVHAGGLD